MCWYWKWGTTAIVAIISSETQRRWVLLLGRSSHLAGLFLPPSRQQPARKDGCGGGDAPAWRRACLRGSPINQAGCGTSVRLFTSQLPWLSPCLQGEAARGALRRPALLGGLQARHRPGQCIPNRSLAFGKLERLQALLGGLQARRLLGCAGVHRAAQRPAACRCSGRGCSAEPAQYPDSSTDRAPLPLLPCILQVMFADPMHSSLPSKPLQIVPFCHWINTGAVTPEDASKPEKFRL